MRELIEAICHLIAGLRHAADRDDDPDLHRIVDKAEAAAKAAKVAQQQAKVADDSAQTAATDALNAAELVQVERQG